MSKLRAFLLSTLIGLACLAGGLYYHKITTRGNYSSATKFQILQRSEPTGAASGIGGREDNWLENQIAVLTSPAFLSRVVKVLHLDAEWHLTPEKAIERLQQRVDVVREGSTEIVVVTGWGDTTFSAAELANTVRKTYEDMRNEAEQERFRRLIKHVGDEIEQQAKQVELERLEVYKLFDKYGDTGGFRGETKLRDRPEYQAAKQRYEGSVKLLNTLRELLDRQKADEGAIRKPIEVLEEAHLNP